MKVFSAKKRFQFKTKNIVFFVKSSFETKKKFVQALSDNTRANYIINLKL
jgi:hypothetical protein